MRCDEEVRPIIAEIVAGNANHRGIAFSLSTGCPSQKTPILDKGSDTDRIREKLKGKEIEARIPSRANNRTEPVPRDEEKCERRRENRENLRAYRWLRSIVMRRDGCRDPFMGAVVLAIIAIFRMRGYYPGKRRRSGRHRSGPNWPTNPLRGLASQLVTSPAGREIAPHCGTLSASEKSASVSPARNAAFAGYSGDRDSWIAILERVSRSAPYSFPASSSWRLAREKTFDHGIRLRG